MLRSTISKAVQLKSAETISLVIIIIISLVNADVNGFGRICPGVCFVRALTFESLDLQNILPVGQDRISRSLDLGHRSKQLDIECITKCANSRTTVRLRLKELFIPFSQQPLTGLLMHTRRPISSSQTLQDTTRHD